MNIISLIGRLTKDPELKFGQSGKAYTKFSIAVDRAFQKGETDFINCSAFGKTAELIGEYMKKGSRIGIIGALHMNRYENNGEKKVTYEVVVNNIDFLDSKSDSNNNGNNNYSKPTNNGGNNYSKPSGSAPAKPEYNGGNDSFDTDEFPF